MGPYYKHRASSNVAAALWSWLVYTLSAFAIGLGLSYCTIQVLETAAKVAV